MPVHVQYMHDIPMICSQGLDSESNGRKCVQREQCDDVKARSVGSGFARLTQMKLEQRVKFETATACLRHRWVSIQAVVRVMLRMSELLNCEVCIALLLKPSVVIERELDDSNISHDCLDAYTNL